MIDKTMLNVIYYLTNNCNYTCDYCCNKNVRAMCRYEPTKNDITHMIKLLSKYSIETFLVYGGEPTISNNLFHLIDCLNEYTTCKEIKITTNASNKKCFEYIVNNYDTDKFYIYATIHLQKYTTKLLDTLLYIKKHFKKFTLAIIMDKRYRDVLYDFIPVWRENFTKEETFFQIVRDSSWGETMGMHTNEFSDMKFLIEVSKKLDINIHEFLDFKKVPQDFIGKKCCNNFIRIGANGVLTEYQGYCFDKSIDTRCLYTLDEYDYNFPIKVCNKTYHPYIMCQYCTHED